MYARGMTTRQISDQIQEIYGFECSDGLKNRGVKEVMIICADGLSGFRQALETVFPETEYQRCIVHQVRNTLKYVSCKNRKLFWLLPL